MKQVTNIVKVFQEADVQPHLRDILRKLLECYPGAEDEFDVFSNLELKKNCWEKLRNIRDIPEHLEFCHKRVKFFQSAKGEGHLRELVERMIALIPEDEISSEESCYWVIRAILIKTLVTNWMALEAKFNSYISEAYEKRAYLSALFSKKGLPDITAEIFSSAKNVEEALRHSLNTLSEDFEKQRKAEGASMTMILWENYVMKMQINSEKFLVDYFEVFLRSVYGINPSADSDEEIELDTLMCRYNSEHYSKIPSLEEVFQRVVFHKLSPGHDEAIKNTLRWFMSHPEKTDTLQRLAGSLGKGDLTGKLIYLVSIVDWEKFWRLSDGINIKQGTSESLRRTFVNLCSREWGEEFLRF